MWGTDVFTKDLKEAMVERPTADEVHCCDNDSHHVTELFWECLMEGVAMEYKMCHDDVRAPVFHQGNETGPLSHHRRGPIRAQ